MESVIISDFGVMLGRTSERLVVKGPRPRFELIEGGPQLWLPLDLPRVNRGLSLVTSSGMKEPPAPLRQVKPKEGAPPAKPKAEQIELPLFRIEEIVVASRGVSISSDLIESCCERGIRIAFLSSTGQPVAMLSSPMLTATVQTRREQMAAYGDKRGVEIARAIVRGKVANQRNLLKYFGKYQKDAAPTRFAELQDLARALGRLSAQARRVEGAQIDEARGAMMAIEGAAGRHYWAGVRLLIGERAEFETREHRGASDAVNAALNYGYGILYSKVWGAIMNAGLEPFAGFLHVDRPGKPSLVLDMVEEFRQPIVDRAIVAIVTKGTGIDLRGGMLTEESRKTVASAVLERLETEVAFHGRRHAMKSVIQMQARRMAGFVRGEGGYRPFAFKW
jgi:CRISPR-associated protein Cas1